MTDRVKGFTVTLEKDIRIDDVESIMKAIEMIKGVGSVVPSVTDYNDHMNRKMVMVKVRNSLYDFIDTELK